MIQTVLFAVLAFLIAPSVFSLDIVKRSDWGAQPAKDINYINHSVPFVVIHHSAEPAACYSEEKCVEAMQTIQRFHQVDRGWFDIGYSFGVGGDGRVYEGRGFNVIAAHAPKYNDKSIGIVLIGDWRDELPPANMLQTTHDFIAFAINQGHLSSNYTLIGHRQVRNTECPGNALFNEIKKWPNFESDANNLV